MPKLVQKNFKNYIFSLPSLNTPSLNLLIFWLKKIENLLFWQWNFFKV